MTPQTRTPALCALLCAAAAVSQAQVNSSPYQPITSGGRFEWAIFTTINLESFGAGLVSSGWGVYRDHPKEYGTGAEGFGKRFALRLSGVAVSNTMEAGLGAVWGEDPRYPRDAGESFRHRMSHVAKMTFYAKNREGRSVPAYARYTAIGGSNFLSNSWRPDSDATAGHAGIRIGLGFLGRFGSNAYYEFWPDIKSRFWKH